MSLADYAQSNGFRRSLLSATILSVTFGLSGCLVDGDEATSTSTSQAETVTNPTQNIEDERQITGIVQGVLRDRVSGDPIQGATVRIGVQEATTDDLGQYVIENVPVTSPTFESGGDEMYRVTIDLRDADSGSDYPYPDFLYDTASVTFGRFTALEAEDMAGGNFQQGTFHQVISGLVSAHDLQVGKLSTSVSGKVVAGLNELLLEPHSALEGATVYLYQMSSSDVSNRVVARATTDANGHFSFDRVEAQADLRLVALYEDQYGDEYYQDVEFSAPNRDGEEVRFNLLDSAGVAGLRGPALQVSLLEQQGPVISSISPEKHSDVTLEDGAVDVRFHFNRPLHDNVYAQAIDPASSAIEGLYADVAVTYNGTKIEHGSLRPNDDEPGPNYSLHWEDGYQTLVVSLQNLAEAALYTVDISGAEGANKLVDRLNRPARLSGVGSHGAIADPVVEFTTRGDGAPEVPAPTLVSSNIDTTDNIMLEWNQVDHARRYHVYTQRVELNPDVDGYQPGYWDVAEITTARYSEPANLISADGNPMAVYYKVTAVNADGTESDYSDVIGPITDNVNPGFVAIDDSVDVSGTNLILDVSEPIRELLEENGTSIDILLQDADEEAISVEEVAADEGNTFIEVELSNAMDVPTFDDLADETLGRIRTGWNGVWRTGTDLVLNNFGYTDYERQGNLPALNTGLCMTVSNEEGNLFSRNSDDYENGEVLSMTLAALDVNDDNVFYEEDEDTWYVFTGTDGVCDSVTALLNYFHDNTNMSGDNSPWIDEADTQGFVVTDSDYSGAAEWALGELEGALLGDVSLAVSASYFRTANWAESLTQLAFAGGVDEFWTEPNDLSESTLSQLTQNDDRSRAGSAAPLGASWYYVLDGGAPLDARPNVLYFDDDAVQAHFAWRATMSSPTTNAVVYTFRENVGTDWEGLEEAIEDRGDRALAYSLNEFERSVEILHVAPNTVEDIAGNNNSGYTLMRTYTRSEDLSETDTVDWFRMD